MKIQKIRAGEYLYGDYAIIREDYPSMGEWDETPRDVTWFVAPAENIDDTGLPEALFAAGTLNACKRWVERASTGSSC